MRTPFLIKQIESAGLLGRGCGTFPVSKKWQAVLTAPGKDKYVICNCSESEPGIFKDQFILDRYPEKVVEGMMLAVKTLKAVKAFFYLNPFYYHRFRHKLEILTGRDPIELFCKPAADYIGGEESAAINLMEGRREEPRLKPPFITQAGLFGQPTLVNNCETFYQVALIAKDEYHNERFFCVSGDNTPRNVSQWPERMAVKDVLIKSGHYPTFPFFIQLGGAMSGTCLREDQLEDCQIQPYSGLIIRDKNKDEKKLISGWLKFFRDQSCGQCVPCREGTYRLYEMYESGQYDPVLFSDVINTMQTSSLCSFGKMAVNAITTYYENIKRININDSSIGFKCEEINRN